VTRHAPVDPENGAPTPNSSRSRRLRSALSLTRNRLTGLIGSVWYHPRLGELYPEFLFACYGVTTASAPAMLMAAEQCDQLGKDPLREPLRAYYLEHAEEERDHGEWLLSDLVSLGVDRARALDRLPYPSAAALVGSQYYWIRHVHPAAYLGYIAVLESPTDAGFLRDVSERAGLPLASMSCHLRHAELDPGHVAEFDAALDVFPLTRQQEELIALSALSTLGHLERLFAEILDHFARIENPALRSTIFTANASAAVAAMHV
jgi:hypothetical protein